MDIVRIFDNLPEWTRGFNAEQAAILDRLMLAADTRGFSGIDVEEVRRIQAQLLRSSEDAGRQGAVKDAALRLAPIISGITFI